MDTKSNHIETVRKFYEVCLNQHKPELLEELISPEIVNHFANQRGIEAFRANLANMRRIFPDQRFTVEDVLTDGNSAAARWRMEATHSAPLAGVPATGKRVTQRGIVMYRFEGAKISEIWVQVETLGMMQQLGAFPSPPLAQNTTA
jgi:steroid delta-isomerase-like uncharacterized protein